MLEVAELLEVVRPEDLREIEPEQVAAPHQVVVDVERAVGDRVGTGVELPGAEVAVLHAHDVDGHLDERLDRVVEARVVVVERAVEPQEMARPGRCTARPVAQSASIGSAANR